MATAITKDLIKKITIQLNDGSEIVIENNQSTILSQISGIANIPNFENNISDFKRVRTGEDVFFIINAPKHLVNDLNEEILDFIKSRIQTE